jgi:hypothetical protein
MKIASTISFYKPVANGYVHLQPDPQELTRNELEEYHLAKQIKLPSQVPASAGGLNKTSK